MMAGALFALSWPLVFFFLILPFDSFVFALIPFVILAVFVAGRRPGRREWKGILGGFLIGIALIGLLVGACFGMVRGSFH